MDAITITIKDGKWLADLEGLLRSLLAYKPPTMPHPAGLDAAEANLQRLKRIYHGDMAISNEDNPHWRVSKGNDQYAICPTYPRAFLVPRTISDVTLKHAAKFRSRSRVPIVSYIHPNETAILRSSQPLAGIQKNRSIQDERIIEAALNACPRKEMMITDARPGKAALAQAMVGTGSMPLENYPRCERVQLGIENIHMIRGCYFKALELMLEDGISLASALDKSDWIKHHHRLMEGVKTVVDHVLRGISVLVHCSDGWDRTAQLVSLSQICLDPNTRTIRGLADLIFREWLSSGHKFEERLAHNMAINSLSLMKSRKSGFKRALDSLTSSSNSNQSSSHHHHHHHHQGKSDESEGASNDEMEDEMCPIFPQFIESLFQFIRVFPRAFEYNQQLLREIWIESFTNKHLAFSANCDRERKTTDQVFWDYINADREKYINPAYDPTTFLIITKDLLHDFKSLWSDNVKK